MLPVIDLGNVSALRTARVLRALKTVAVVPGEYVAEFEGNVVNKLVYKHHSTVFFGCLS